MGNDENRPIEDAGCPYTGDGPTDDEGLGGRGCSADDRAKLKEANRAQVYPLYRIERIEFSKEELKGTSCQKVPANVKLSANGRRVILHDS